MSLPDKSNQCSDCEATFIFSVEEQEFFHFKGYTDEPKRCPTCRAKRKMERYEDGDHSYKSRYWRRDVPEICA